MKAKCVDSFFHAVEGSIANIATPHSNFLAGEHSSALSEQYTKMAGMSSICYLYTRD